MDLFIQPFQQTQQSMRIVTRKIGKHTHIPQNAAAKNRRRSTLIPTTLWRAVCGPGVTMLPSLRDTAGAVG